MHDEFKGQCYESYNLDQLIFKLTSILYCRA